MVTAIASPQARSRIVAQEQIRLGARGDSVTIILGLWLMGGIFIDGWAHNSRTLVENFFTPWHAVLYSGYGASTVWLCWLVLAGRRAGRIGVAAIPRGYGLGLVGAMVFGFGGLGDMLWHAIFGIETGLEQLLSPTYLLLLVGVLLILINPLRSAWSSPDDGAAPTLRAFLPALLALTAAVSAISFIGAYSWAIIDNSSASGVVRAYAQRSDASRLLSLSQRHGLEAILITNVLLIAPIFLLLRRWQLPFGSITLFFTINTALMNALEGFAFAERILVALFVGLAAEGLLRALRPAAERPSAARIFGGLVPFLFWSLFFLANWLRYGIGWAPELWTGAIVLTTLSGIGLSLLAVPPPMPPGQREARGI